jgi:chemotaxis protein methyltransferase CheR
VTVSLADSSYVRRLLREQSSIALGEDKEYLIEARLAPLVRREGLGSVTALIDMLRTGETELRDEVIGALTTNETWFFRDGHPFDSLRQHVIPAVLAANDNRSLSMWSAAASTGQEAYSLALLVLEHFPEVPRLTIVGSDLSDAVLARARSGRFTQFEVNRGLPVQLLVKYFTREGLQWRLIDRVRAMVTFQQLNLANALPPMPAMDIVLLRNVLIYFEPLTREVVLDRIRHVLRPGGYLFLGSTETTYGLGSTFERVQFGKTTCYQLTDRREQ